jgi:hypothetical protein
MSFFRQYIAPLFVVVLFCVVLLAVSARVFLPEDMAQPAPVDEPAALSSTAVSTAISPLESPSPLSVLVNGLPAEPSFAPPLSAQL